ncbi:MAG: SPFH domain-containing protein [Candidatus Delongbacteria bacterium]|jgi:regulator of protease activity HflC (stomatin/prohibitin superfamily)|nr:SPFH domain-containing protein [Candidatus Delongbacteria bacterium]
MAVSGFKQFKVAFIVLIVLIVVLFGKRFFISIEAGHIGVATLFGEVQEKVYEEGLNIPVNPLYRWHIYDVREKTHLEQAQVPTQDQLQTSVDVSVQFRLMAESAPEILKSTGQFEDVLRIHIVPKLRSIIREQGKSIKRAEDFFTDETQTFLENSLLSGLREYLEPKGVEVSAVLIRDITLPKFISIAIEKKKEREQEVEKQKAELERFKTEQQQKIAQAEAERTAAAMDAEKIKLLADAEAYRISKINNSIANNTNYIKLQALEALKAISKDDNAKIYFLNGDSPNPLPLMNIGDTKK